MRTMAERQHYFAIPEGTASITQRDSVSGEKHASWLESGVDPRGVTSVTIPPSVTSIGGYFFKGCSTLARVDIPTSVTSTGGYAFFYCSSLTSITFPSSVTSIGACAFQGCSALTSITPPSSVTSIEQFAFSGCSASGSVDVPTSDRRKVATSRALPQLRQHSTRRQKRKIQTVRPRQEFEARSRLTMKMSEYQPPFYILLLMFIFDIALSALRFMLVA